MAEALADVYVRFRDKNLKGECTDSKHPGEDGWIQIKTFSFSFGMKEGSWDSGGSSASDSGGDGGGSGASSGKSGGSNLPLEFPEVTITKSADLATTGLLKQKCYDGGAIEILEVVACRYGGNDSENMKIPFLHIYFKNVYINSVSLSLSQDELPGETIKFTYDIVQMDTVWTDNETGDRLVSQPNRCGWNKKLNKEHREYIEP